MLSFRIMNINAYNALVYLNNFQFFLRVELPFPRIPKIATLLYFWVFVVKVKIENSIKSTARCVSVHIRYGFTLLGCQSKNQNFLKNTCRIFMLIIQYYQVCSVKVLLRVWKRKFQNTEITN